MAMSERVARLRQESLDAVPRISTERAELMTAFYQQNTGLMSVPMRRALAFAYLMEHKTICINEGELIVGEKGPAPKATPTYPELCCHSLQDLDILNSRPKIPFVVSPEARRVYKDEIIPFWQGKTMRELVFSQMTPEWLAAYGAGLFTEFMEQRSPGHTVLDDKIYHRGMLDFVGEIDQSLAGLDDLADPAAYHKREQLKAMRVCALALVRFAERYAERARELAEVEADVQRKAELQRIAEVCTRVPAHAPRDFWEALQYVVLTIAIMSIESNGVSVAPGRVDQYLYPYYQRDIEQGRLTRDQAVELCASFLINGNLYCILRPWQQQRWQTGYKGGFGNPTLGGQMPDDIEQAAIGRAIDGRMHRDIRWLASTGPQSSEIIACSL